MLFSGQKVRSELKFDGKKFCFLIYLLSNTYSIYYPKGVLYKNWPYMKFILQRNRGGISLQSPLTLAAVSYEYLAQLAMQQASQSAIWTFSEKRRCCHCCFLVLQPIMNQMRWKSSPVTPVNKKMEENLFSACVWYPERHERETFIIIWEAWCWMLLVSAVNPLFI